VPYRSQRSGLASAHEQKYRVQDGKEFFMRRAVSTGLPVDGYAPVRYFYRQQRIISFHMILQEKMEKIKSLLKKEPKGLTISDLSHRIKLNRNSLAKYLEILLVTGQVEMESFGTAKVYCLSRRVPVTALLQFASDLIAMVDEEYTFIQVNDNFLGFFGIKREDLLKKRVDKCSLPPITNEPLVQLIRQAQEHGEITREIQWKQGEGEVYLRERIIPTVFDNGNRGATLIIENTTKQRQYEARLAESEEKYRALAENTLDGILIMRFDGTAL
jgi:PAS domain S-box-containing protein